MAIVFKIAVESGEEGSPLETLPSTAGVPTTLERIRQGLIFSGEFHKISNAQDLLGTDDRALALQRLVQQTPPVWSQPAGQKPAKGLQALPRPSSDCERHLAALAFISANTTGLSRKTRRISRHISQPARNNAGHPSCCTGGAD